MKISRDKIYYDQNMNIVQYMVYLNGENQEDYFEADDKEGWVILRKEYHSPFITKPKISFKKKHGTVHIVRILDDE